MTTVHASHYTQYVADAIFAAPNATSGLVIAPWDRSEVYGVAANWSQAAAPVFAFCAAGWQQTVHQVATYRHRPRLALRAQIAEALTASGDDPDEADSIITHATRF